jgi:hypothetical protein
LSTSLLCTTKDTEGNLDRYQIQFEDFFDGRHYKVSKFISYETIVLSNQFPALIISNSIEVVKSDSHLPFKIEISKFSVSTPTEICNDIWSQFMQFPAVQVLLADPAKLIHVLEDIMELVIIQTPSEEPAGF